MTNRVATVFGAAALLAQCLFSSACSSSGGSMTGTGGMSGGTGTGGAGTGSGMCDKGAASAPSMGDPCVDVKNKAACNADGVMGTADDKTCWNTCGPNKSGVKNCTCTGGAWSCPTCDYDISDPSKFSCYKTAGSAACPPDPTDTTSGNMLPASGGPCTQDACKACGSASAVSYRDSSGSPKAGWCICVPKPDGSGSVYSCASVGEWAPQCN